MSLSFLRAAAAALTLLLGTAAAAPAPSVRTEKVVFAGGCFWGVEAVFASLKGVTSAVSGYAGGAKATAHYDMVSTGTTGHAESVEVTYHPQAISFNELLEVFLTVAHDPTERDRQGPDTGSQYRSVIFFTNANQARAAEAAIKQLTERKAFRDPIVTQVMPLRGFYPAEAYHQHFLERNPNYPYIVYNDIPKLKALAAKFPALVKPNSAIHG